MIGLLRHFRQWADMLVMFIAFAMAAVIDSLTFGYSISNLLVIIPADFAEVLIIASILAFVGGGKFRLENGYRAGAWITSILCGCIISGGLVGLILGVIPNSVFSGSGPLSAITDWMLGDALGYLIIGTPILVLTDRNMRNYGQKRIRERRFEFALLCFTTLIAVTLSFMGPELFTGPNPTLHHAGYLFLCLPCFIWSAFRFGLPGATFSIAVSSIPAVYITSFGFGPFAYGSDQVSVNELQLLLIILSSTVLLTGALVHALEIEMQKTEQANQAKSRFLSALGHEIRTPLNGILGSAQLLMNEIPADADPEKKLRLISDSGMLLAQLVEDLLTFADLGEHGIELHETNFDLIHAVRDTTALFSDTAKGKNLDLILNLDKRDHLLVRSDEMRIRQVLLNLISNAIKFTPSGFVGVDLKIVERVDDIRVQIFVQDSGPGLTGEKRSHIFDSFQGQMGSGLGIGLTTCREIADVMKGSLTVRDQIGGGLIFIFEFRAGYPQTIPETDKLLSKDMMKPMKVLLAEDHEGNTRVMTAMLTAMNADVTHVRNGQQAVNIFREYPFDLVLMDVQMPVMDGETAIEIIRAHESESPLDMVSRTPIIVVSAHAQASDQARFLRLGADGFLSKPVTPRQLSATILQFQKQEIMAE